MTRVLENDGFDFTKSADVIHAYCCFRSKCYQDFLELETLYAEAAKDVAQGTIEEKPEHFTEACCLEMKKVPDGIRTTLCLDW